MKKESSANQEEKCCGLVMPISAIDGCNEQHWLEVKAILTEAVDAAGFKASLVSYADDVGIIQKRIIQNLYDNPIVICDVSGKNPNVMFELGMRLAFDKPTIIVKDDKTSYSFDTSSIEHLEYPRDLRFAKIVEFKQALKEKLNATFNKSQTDPNYTTFLKHFGTFTVAKLDSKEVSKEDFIIEELKELKKSILRQHVVYNERGYPMPPPVYGKYSKEKPYVEMRKAIRDVYEKVFPEAYSSKVNTTELKSMVYERVLDMPDIKLFFGGLEEFEHVFNSVYQDLGL